MRNIFRIFLAFSVTAVLADEPLMLNTKDHKVVSPPIIDFSTATVLGLPLGTGTVTSLTATAPIVVTPSPIITTGAISLDPATKTNWDTAFTDRLKWDGGITGLNAATGRTSLGLGTAAQSDTTAFVPVSQGVPSGGAANAVLTKASAADHDMTWRGSTGTGTNVLATNPTITNPSIAKLANLPINGFVKTINGDGTLWIDTTSYLTGNQTITLTGDVTGSGATSLATTISNNAVTYSKMQAASATSKLIGSSAASTALGEITLGTNLSMSGTTLNAITSGGGGTPGGSNTQVQFNNSGAFGGDSGLTYLGSGNLVVGHSVFLPATNISTSAGLYMGSRGALQTHDDGTISYLFFATNKAFSGSAWTDLGASRKGGDLQINNDQLFYATFDTGTTQAVQFTVDQNRFALTSSMELGWGSGAYPFTIDTGMVRTSAGVLEINNGTAGQYRDLQARNVLLTGNITGQGAVPTGGNVGQVVTKLSPTAYDYNWSDGIANRLLLNTNTSDNTGFAADQYLTGSSVVPTGGFKAKGQYHCVFDMVKTNAGTVAPVITVRIGTAGTTSDTSRMTFTFGAGTNVVDTGIFEVWIVWRSVGSGTSAVISGMCKGVHDLATTGLFNNAAAWTIVGTTSAGFDSSTATTMGLSFNGGTSFSGTNKVVQASLQQ